MSKKILVAMSGGVDSSVSLLKIIEQGFEPVGVTMKLWEYQSMGGNIKSDNNCCAIESINNAKLVCDQFEIPHYTLDFTKIFKEKVVDNFSNEYIAGRTPNPCVRCNSYVKWDALIDYADMLNIPYIATGHYAQIDKIDHQYFLKKGIDNKKDQSYVLWGIPRDTLARTFFPLGQLTKKDVRKIANDNKLQNANEPESMEICFVADNNYKRFLKDYSPDKIKKIGNGTIIDENDNTIGKHKGYINYTIGQRKGIGLTSPEPLYVKNIDSKKNQITVSKKQSLFKTKCKATNINLLVDQADFPNDVSVQIRYNSIPAQAKIQFKEDAIEVNFSEPQLAITPGQSIVFYNDNILLGGGIIAY